MALAKITREMISLSSVAVALVRQAVKKAVSKGLKAGLKRAGARLTTFDVHIFRASQGTLINPGMFSDYLKNILKVSPKSHAQMMSHFNLRIGQLKSMGLLARHPAANTLRFTRKGIQSLKNTTLPLKIPASSRLSGSLLDIVLSPSLRSASGALLKRETTRSVRKALKKAYKSERPPRGNTMQPARQGHGMPRYAETVRIRGKRFTPDQLEKLTDLGTFRNLSLDQMGFSTHDLHYLKKLGILDHHTIWSKNGLERVVFLREEGKRSVSEYTGRLDIQTGPYTKKASEFYHDKKAYDAYQVLRAKIESEGGRVEAVHTDLHMRSEHSAEGHSGYELSDLRIQYTDANGEFRTLEAEVDVGYSSGLIADKMSASPGMVWLTDSQAQAQKIEQVARSLNQETKILTI